MNSLFAFFALGLLGSGHCVAMCGALSLAATQAEGGGGFWRRQLAYHGGKTTAYVSLAVVGHAVGTALLQSAMVAALQNALAVVAGAAMALLGLQWLTGWRFAFASGRWLGRTCNLVSAISLRRSFAGTFLLGWFNGFLPCGLLWIALAYAAVQPDLAHVAASAAVFGAATVPGLLALACVGRLPGARGRTGAVRLAGCALLALGVFTAVRGVPAVHHWTHRHLLAGADFVRTNFPLLRDGRMPEWCEPAARP